MALIDGDVSKRTDFLSTNSVVEVKRNNNGACEYITECVDSSSIRPLPPPPVAGQSYEPLDIVDALHRGGWRKGVVSQVGILKKNSKAKGYCVVFSNPTEKFLFGSENLRFHSDWINGNWVSPPKLQVSLNRPRREEQSAVTKGSGKNLLVNPALGTGETRPNNSDEFKNKNFANSDKGADTVSILMESTEQATCSSGGNLPLAGSYNLDGGSDAVKTLAILPKLKGANNQEAELEKGTAEISMKRGEPNAPVAGEEGKIDENRLEAINEGNVENLEPVENYELPFTKSSSIWQLIDSLPVFQELPQKPHFRPMLERCEATREGFAIGHMWYFANLVEMVSKLEVESPTSLFETYLEALAYLESLGFDVKPVVNRINKLLSIKTRQEQLGDESKDVHSKIAQCVAEKTGMKRKIDEIGRKIKELKAQQAMEDSKNARLESESNILQMNANRINGGVSNGKLDFESLAAAPLKKLV